MYDGPPRPAGETARLECVNPAIGWSPWHVGIELVDGQRAAGPVREPHLLQQMLLIHGDTDHVEYAVDVEPGEHEIGLLVGRGSISGASLRRQLRFRAEAGHDYRIEHAPSERQPPVTFVVRDVPTGRIVFDSSLGAEEAVAARIELDPAAWEVLDWRVDEDRTTEVVRATTWRRHGEPERPWTQSVDAVCYRTESASPALEAVMLDAARDLRARYDRLEWSVVERDVSTRVCRWSGVPRGELALVNGVTCVRAGDHRAYVLRYATRSELAERDFMIWSDKLRSAALQ